jgi:hypothetical protein
MVNISTNINKTKESFNSDGEHFHQYQQIHNHQQKEQLPLTSTH